VTALGLITSVARAANSNQDYQQGGRQFAYIYGNHDYRLNYVRLVGIIYNYVHNAPSQAIEFDLDDSTAAIKCIINLPKEKSIDKEKCLLDWERKIITIQQQLAYARLSGTVKYIADNIYIHVFDVCRVDDSNEITYHLLDCINCYHVVTNSPQSPVHQVGLLNNNANVKQQSNEAVQAVLQDAFREAMHKSKRNVASTSYNLPTANNAYCQLSEREKTILSSISSAESSDPLMNEKGVDIEYILRQYSYLTRLELQNTLELLTMKGALYSTIDDSHFKAIN
jgi:hypothetical protein